MDFGKIHWWKKMPGWQLSFFPVETPLYKVSLWTIAALAGDLLKMPTEHLRGWDWERAIACGSTEEINIWDEDYFLFTDADTYAHVLYTNKHIDAHIYNIYKYVRVK